jgi:hypothetical protein
VPGPVELRFLVLEFALFDFIGLVPCLSCEDLVQEKLEAFLTERLGYRFSNTGDLLNLLLEVFVLHVRILS